MITMTVGNAVLTATKHKSLHARKFLRSHLGLMVSALSSSSH